MKSIFSFVVVLLFANSAFAAGYDVSAKAYKSAKAPTQKQLENAYWLVVALASAPGQGGANDGVWPTGQIPCGNETCTQLMRVSFSGSRVTAKVNFTGARGTVLESTQHTGKLRSSALVLKTAGGREVCATKTECRILPNEKLICAQSNDDQRGVCLASYTKNPAAYITYAPVHP